MSSNERRHAERDKQIIALKKVGKTQGEICKLLDIQSVNIITGAIARARKQGAFPPPKKKPAIRKNTVLNAHLCRTRADKDSQWWIERLPKDSRQCRWPAGELLEGDLCFCKNTREKADTIPLALDPLPYCIGHKEKAQRKGNRKTDAATTRRNVNQYRLQYAIARL